MAQTDYGMTPLTEDQQREIAARVMARHSLFGPEIDAAVDRYKTHEANMADHPLWMRYKELSKLSHDELVNMVLRAEGNTQSLLDWIVWRGPGRSFEAPPEGKRRGLPQRPGGRPAKRGTT